MNVRFSILVVASLSLLSACDRTTGTKARAVITADPAALDFGSQTGGTQTQRTVRLGNDGSAALKISSVQLFQDTRGAFSVGQTPTTISPGQQVDVVVTYSAPAAEGPDGASLTVASDAENTIEFTISLAGRSTAACTPKTCLSAATNCGDVNDGCGGTIACGSCVAPQGCGGGGTANVCGCTGETTVAFCARQGATCGTVTGADNCGLSRTADCGVCTAPESCGGGGTSNACGCAPESGTAFCARLGRNCDSVTAADNCGASRTISCGACSGNQSCGGSGVPNVCGCVAETNAAFCVRAGKNCGAVTANDNCGVSRVVGSCGTCMLPETCGSTQVCSCVPETDPTFCSRLNANCGPLTATDSCGVSRTVASCGTCGGVQTCGGVTPNQCGCASETNTAFCARLGNNCGSVTGTDNCGAARTAVACGTCTPVTQTCNSSNICVCAPETDLTFCTRLGKNCGSVTAPDNCGAARTVPSCGTCTGPQSCSGTNVCACTAENDSAFCTRLMKNCGSVTAPDSCGTGRTVASCGSCTGPQTCGGTGTVNVCGTTSFAVNVTVSGTGGGSVASTPAGITCGTTCSASFLSGSTVTLTVSPGVTSTFTGFSGDCTGLSCSLSIDGVKNVTANFAPLPTSWTQRFPTGTAPSARYSQRAAMDVANNRMIVFSGADGNIQSVPTLHSDTWVLSNADGSSTPAWTLLAPSGLSPPTRGYPVVGYDPTANALVMYGGNRSIGNCFQTISDTWVLSNANGLGGTPVWTQRSPPMPPSNRNLHTGVYDTVNRRLIVYGGQDACAPDRSDIWVLSNIFSGTITWTQLTPVAAGPAGLPAPRSTQVAVYDQANNRMIIWGGQNQSDNLPWVLTNANGLGATPTWIQLTPTGTPPVRTGGGAAVYDAAENKLVVLVGGPNAASSAALQTWVLTNANGLGGTPAWQQLTPTGGPPAVTQDQAIWYQPGTDRVGIWGGLACANNSCALTGVTWTLYGP